MKFNLNIRLLALFLVFTITAQAQEDWEEGDGEIEDVEIEIVKDREITLPRANRNFQKISPLSLSPISTDLNYFFSDLDLPLPALNIRVRPLRMKEEKLNKLYGNYLRAGFGNFVTPYFEGYVTTKRNRDYSLGAHINYLNSQRGPIGEENSGSGRFDARVFAKSFGEKVTVGGEVGFKRRNFNFYGLEIPVTADVMIQEQIFNNFYISGTLENTDKTSDLEYLVGAQFDFLTDDFEAEESEVQLDFKGEYKIGEYGAINLLSDLDIITQTDEGLETKTRNIFRVLPSFTFEYEGLLFDAGFNVVYENDTLGDSDELHFYPMVRARYNLSSGFEVHAGIRGDVDKLTLRQLTNQNPFLGSNTQVFNSYNTFEFFGGISGSLTSKIGFAASTSIANYNNMAFFLNRPLNEEQFFVTYDTGDVSVFNLNGQFSYNNDDEFRLTISGDYWGYNTDELEEAWHRPTFRLSALSTYTLVDKIRFETELFSVGGIKAFDFENDTSVDLDAFLDINFTAEYLVSDQFSVWLRLNNLLSNEYEMLYNYPVRGFQFMIGASYSFK